MIFIEKKVKNIFEYITTDVFGELEIKSKNKIKSQVLDDIVYSILKIKNNSPNKKLCLECYNKLNN